MESSNQTQILNQFAQIGTEVNNNHDAGDGAALLENTEQQVCSLMLSSATELATRVSGYRPTFRLPMYSPGSVGKRSWKPYAASWEWSPEQVSNMFAELRVFVQKNYLSPQQLTGFETFHYTQIMFGHFAASYILKRDQVRFTPTSKRAHPPAPKQLQQIFQLHVSTESSLRSIASISQTTSLPLFKAQSRRIRGPQLLEVENDDTHNVSLNTSSVQSTTPAMTKSIGCLHNCSEQDIRCNKYILHYGLGVYLWTILPNGQSMAAFATQYVYNEHMRRMARKRKQCLIKHVSTTSA